MSQKPLLSKDLWDALKAEIDRRRREREKVEPCSGSYRKGCRCAVCREGSAAARRAYRAANPEKERAALARARERRRSVCPECGGEKAPHSYVPVCPACAAAKGREFMALLEERA